MLCCRTYTLLGTVSFRVETQPGSYPCWYGSRLVPGRLGTVSTDRLQHSASQSARRTQSHLTSSRLRHSPHSRFFVLRPLHILQTHCSSFARTALSCRTLCLEPYPFVWRHSQGVTPVGMAVAWSQAGSVRSAQHSTYISQPLTQPVHHT